MLGYPTRALADGAIVGAFFTSADFIEKNPILAKKLSEAITEAQLYAAAHPEEVRAVLPTYTRLSESDVKNLSLIHI